MQEYANIFFMLLTESYRISAEQRLEDITVASVPHMQKEDSEIVIDSYKMQANDILDLTRPVETRPEDLQRVRDLFNGVI